MSGRAPELRVVIDVEGRGADDGRQNRVEVTRSPRPEATMQFASVRWLKLVCCMAWAGAGLSSAGSAQAYALMDPVLTGSGNYVSCTNTSSAASIDCSYYHFSYRQSMKFISSSCNSGTCAVSGNVYTDFVYTTGRKTVSTIGQTCQSPSGTSVTVYANVVALGSCSC
jgi:hypothetical protein